VRYHESINNRIQYLVSLASLYEIAILEAKSFSDTHQMDSSMLAQIDVPLLSICFERTNSFFSSVRKRYNLIILKAKE